MVALPGQLFTNTQIPACIWLLTKDKKQRGEYRDRRGEALFIDVRKVGYMVDRVLRAFTPQDMQKIAGTFQAWKRHLSPSPGTRGEGRGEGVESQQAYADIPGFCKSATLAEIAAHGHVLTPGRYVGAEVVEDHGEPFEENMARLVAELNGQFAESAKLEAAIRANMEGLGYGE